MHKSLNDWFVQLCTIFSYKTHFFTYAIQTYQNSMLTKLQMCILMYYILRIYVLCLTEILNFYYIMSSLLILTIISKIKLQIIIVVWRYNFRDIRNICTYVYYCIILIIKICTSTIGVQF